MTATASPPGELTDQELVELAPYHPVAWAMLTAGKHRAKGAEAQRIGVPSGTLVRNWRLAQHLAFMAERCMRLVRGESQRLAISMPPQHGKSQFLSRHFASWWVGSHPEERVILTTYQERLARRFNRQARDDFAAWAPDVFGLDAWARSSTAEWDVFRDSRRTGGGIDAVGRGGALAGKGCGLLVVDDLIKGFKEAQSKAIRDDAWRWFHGEALSRVYGPAIVVFTRWHHDDVIGRLKKRQKAGEIEGWEFINLPAIAEDDDPMGRKPGEALWPQWKPVSFFEALLSGGMPPSVWGALYQGRPTPAEGGLFKRPWIRWYERRGDLLLLPDGLGDIRIRDLARFITADLAVKKKDRSNYSVVSAWGAALVQQMLFLLDVQRGRWGGSEILKRMRLALDFWKASTIHVEDTAYHFQLMDMARVEKKLPVQGLACDTDKVTRALPATGQMSAGMIFLPRHAGWLADFEEELLEFPESAYDDQVDTLSYASQVFRTLSGGGVWIPDYETTPRVYDESVTGQL